MPARPNRSDRDHRSVLRHVAAAAVSAAGVLALTGGCQDIPAPQPSGPVLSGWDPSTGRVRTSVTRTGGALAGNNGATRDALMSGNTIGSSAGAAPGANGKRSTYVGGPVTSDADPFRAEPGPYASGSGSTGGSTAVTELRPRTAGPTTAPDFGALRIIDPNRAPPALPTVGGGTSAETPNRNLGAGTMTPGRNGNGRSD
jgi:hypothetical protein